MMCHHTFVGTIHFERLQLYDQGLRLHSQSGDVSGLLSTFQSVLTAVSLYRDPVRQLFEKHERVITVATGY